MPGSPCIKEKGVRGTRTLEEEPTPGNQQMIKTLSETLPVASSSQSEEIEEELDQEKTQDSKLRPTRPPRTIWHTVTVHV